MNGTRQLDLIAATLLFVMGLVTLFVLIPYGVQVPGSVKNAALSPDFWPRIIAGIAVVASLFLVFETYKMPQPSLDEDDSNPDAIYEYAPQIALARTAIFIVVIFAFYFSLPTLGIVAASVMFLGFAMWFLGERNWIIAGILSVATPLLLYLFFRYIAGVPIPLGMFSN
jgi:putative tricarboxylic transport membrane protein